MTDIAYFRAIRCTLDHQILRAAAARFEHLYGRVSDMSKYTTYVVGEVLLLLRSEVRGCETREGRSVSVQGFSSPPHYANQLQGAVTECQQSFRQVESSIQWRVSFTICNDLTTFSPCVSFPPVKMSCLSIFYLGVSEVLVASSSGENMRRRNKAWRGISATELFQALIDHFWKSRGLNFC